MNFVVFEDNGQPERDFFIQICFVLKVGINYDFTMIFNSECEVVAAVSWDFGLCGKEEDVDLLFVLENQF